MRGGQGCAKAASSESGDSGWQRHGRDMRRGRLVEREARSVHVSLLTTSLQGLRAFDAPSIHLIFRGAGADAAATLLLPCSPLASL